MPWRCHESWEWSPVWWPWLAFSNGGHLPDSPCHVWIQQPASSPCCMNRHPPVEEPPCLSASPWVLSTWDRGSGWLMFSILSETTDAQCLIISNRKTTKVTNFKYSVWSFNKLNYTLIQWNMCSLCTLGHILITITPHTHTHTHTRKHTHTHTQTDIYIYIYIYSNTFCLKTNI